MVTVDTNLIHFGPWTLELDSQRTAEANRSLVPGTERCGCFFCRQFREGREAKDYRFFTDLSTLHLDPMRETEVTHFRELADGSHLFLGWYHAVGRIVEGPESGTFHRWSDDIQVSVVSRRDALPADFPDPTVQIDFIARMPWRGAHAPAS